MHTSSVFTFLANLMIIDRIEINQMFNPILHQNVNICSIYNIIIINFFFTFHQKISLVLIEQRPTSLKTVKMWSSLIKDQANERASWIDLPKADQYQSSLHSKISGRLIIFSSKHYQQAESIKPKRTNERTQNPLY